MLARRLWKNSTFCVQFEVQNKKYSSPLPSFGQLMAFLQFLHMFCMRNLPFPQSNNTQQQQQQVMQQHRRYVRAGSWAFSKAKFLAFLQNVLANFISSKSRSRSQSPSRTQRKSVAYIEGRTQSELVRSSSSSSRKGSATWQHRSRGQHGNIAKQRQREVKTCSFNLAFNCIPKVKLDCLRGESAGGNVRCGASMKSLKS